MRAETPAERAASASPCAWFPALAATTPRLRSAGVNAATRFVAPRSLNEPVRCRFSAFSRTRKPHHCEKVAAEIIGVRTHTPSITARAARISASVTVTGCSTAAGSGSRPQP